MSSNFSSGALSDDDFVYAFADEFLGEELNGADKARFETLVKTQENKDILERYKKEHGQLQIALQAISLNPQQMEELWNSVQAPEARQTQEMQNIAEVSRLEFLGSIKRRSVLTLFLAGLIFSLVYLVTSKRPPKFEYLEYIRYEALAMDRSGSVSEFDLVDPSPTNVLDVYRLDKKLDFTPTILSLSEMNWVITGASILDYEVKKMTMAQYQTRSSDEANLYYFSTSGSLEDLPKAERGQQDSVVYQAYASEFYNIIAFEPDQGTVGFVVGRLAAPEMAKLAARGLKK